MTDRLTTDSGPSSVPSLALEASHVTKTFGEHTVLHDFAVQVRGSSVHALLGHNGSGKSTFIKILSGFHVPDDETAARVLVDGTPIAFGDLRSPARAGVSFVHQTLGLVPDLTVLENLHLGKPYSTGMAGRISWRRERAAATGALEEFDVRISPERTVASLTAVERSEVAIVRALRSGESMRVLVLDEPTAALTEREVDKLFGTIENVRARGVGIVYVSHRLEEVGQIAQDVTILRDGVVVGRGPVAEFPASRLIDVISGAPLAPAVEVDELATLGPPSGVADEPPATASAAFGSESPPRESGVTAGPAFELKATAAGAIHEAHVVGHPGEVLGVVGLLGSGIDDLIGLLTGRVAARRAELRLHGKPVRPGDVPRMLRLGLCLVVGDRDQRVVLTESTGTNLTLSVIGRYFSRGLLRRGAMRSDARHSVEALGVRPSDPGLPTMLLSGGNAQKVALGRALAAEPSILLLEEPSRGVDVQGRRDVGAIVRKAADDGKLVIVVDSDLEQIVEVCTRVLVLRGGRVCDEFVGARITKSALLQACYGTAEERAV
ncbi:MAG: sugar ABC transporter ATP-binding protein [Nocardioides sp.]